MNRGPIVIALVIASMSGFAVGVALTTLVVFLR